MCKRSVNMFTLPPKRFVRTISNSTAWQKEQKVKRAKAKQDVGMKDKMKRKRIPIGPVSSSTAEAVPWVEPTMTTVKAYFDILEDIDIKGYQERIFTGVEWTHVEEAAMCHKQKHLQEFPTMGFTLAFQNKIANSLIGKFLDAKEKMTMEELWCYIIPLKLYDNDHATDEGKICFSDQNCITDNCLNMIKKAVLANDRQVLWSELKRATVLRCLFAKCQAPCAAAMRMLISIALSNTLLLPAIRL